MLQNVYYARDVAAKDFSPSGSSGRRDRRRWLDVSRLVDWQVDSRLEFAQSDMMRNLDAVYVQKQPRQGRGGILILRFQIGWIEIEIPVHEVSNAEFSFC